MWGGGELLEGGWGVRGDERGVCGVRMNESKTII